MTGEGGQMSFDPVFGDPRLPARFWSKCEVDDATGCWVWRGGLSRGYGQFRWGGRTMGAHRVAFEAFLGPVPQGLELDHVACDNPPCVRPSHMSPTTHRVNVLRSTAPVAINARRTECRWGHPLSGDNLRLVTRPGRHPSRRCARCQRFWLRSRAARRRAGPPPIELRRTP